MSLKATLFLSLLALGWAHMHFNPDPELMCNNDKSFTLTVNGVESAFVSVLDFCPMSQEVTMNGEVLTFDAPGTCDSLPEFGETFVIVIRESEVLLTDTVAVFNATCDLADNDTLTLSFVSNVTLPEAGTDGVLDGTAFPTFVVSLRDGTNQILAEGPLGETAVIVIRLNDAFAGDFAFLVTGITVYANGLSEVVVKDGCSLFPTIIPNPQVLTDFTQELRIEFELFSLITDNPPNPTTVTYKVDIFVCQTANAGCPPPAPVCPAGRKRRELAVDSDVSYNLPVVVYTNAADMPPNNNANDNDRNTQDQSSVVEDCESHMPYIWGIIALAIVSLLCVLVMTWLVCRTRENLRNKSYAGSEYHSNGGYKH